MKKTHMRIWKNHYLQPILILEICINKTQLIYSEKFGMEIWLSFRLIDKFLVFVLLFCPFFHNNYVYNNHKLLFFIFCFVFFSSIDWWWVGGGICEQLRELSTVREVSSQPSSYDSFTSLF